MARRAVMAVVEQAATRGRGIPQARIWPPGASEGGHSTLDAVLTSSGERIAAGQFVFACGAWLGKMFPEILGPRIFPSRQEVFFFGVPPGDERFAAPVHADLADPARRSVRNAGPGISRLQDGAGSSRRCASIRTRNLAWSRRNRPNGVRKYVAKRFPALRDAPIVETRVCQYENTSNGDFLIDRHPQMDNVWFAGGGSGHGFKHGPALGEYVARQLLGGGAAEPRFALASKGTEQHRAVY